MPGSPGYAPDMILNLFEGLPFYFLWPVLAVIGVSWYFAICGGLYLVLHRSRFADSARRWKTQIQATRTDQVRGEIRDGVLSMSMVMGCIAISFWSSYHGYNKLYAAPTDYPLWMIPLSIVAVFLIMEVFSWTFHWACHQSDLLWMVHKHHHRYSNPTPFGVMADQPIDMFIKASPILWIPFLFPIWDVALIGTFATMNFAYGTYLHAGFDPPWMPSPHSRYLVSVWHHNEHHAGSLKHNFGFFTGFMDILMSTRLTPTEKSAKREGYRCPECRNGLKTTAVLTT
jgi:sterol desaturase/sphingolipid hydroxylase (fatty acid hydroxylase superfamily)